MDDFRAKKAQQGGTDKSGLNAGKWCKQVNIKELAKYWRVIVDLTRWWN